jgi:hypothetical protein
MIAAETGLGRFGTVAIEVTKIAANASIDANRGKDWFDRCVAAVADSEGTDRAKDTAMRGARDAGLDRVPAGLGMPKIDQLQRLAPALDAAYTHRTGAKVATWRQTCQSTRS